MDPNWATALRPYMNCMYEMGRSIIFLDIGSLQDQIYKCFFKKYVMGMNYYIIGSR